MAYFKVSKVRGVEYLQLWSGDVKGSGSLIRQVGRADKLLKLLVRLDLFEKVTNKYPEMLTKLLDEFKVGSD